MIATIFIAILFLIAFVMLILGNKEVKDNGGDYTVPFRWLSLIPAGIAWIWLFLVSFSIIAPGNVAVPVAFGKAGNAVGAGFHVKPPWAKFHSLNIKVQNYTMSSVAQEGQEARDDSVPVHTKDQVTVGVDSTALFRLNEAHARSVFVNLGGDYVTQIIRPIIRSAIRDNATPYNAIDLATGDRAKFQDAVQRQVESGLGRYGIELVGSGGIQIRDIHLPSTIQDAVNSKAKAQQDVVRQSFVLQSKRAEAQQRIVEAEGLAKSQTIIHSTLNPLYNQYLYITELGKLANSKNTTFLFLPNDPGQLPTFQVPLPVK